MHFKKFEATHNGLKFIIEEDLPGVGVSLLIYSGDNCTHDYLQDTIDMCKLFALEDYEVPENSWKRIDIERPPL